MMFRGKSFPLISLAILLSISTAVFSATHFVVRHIQVKGLQRVSSHRVLSAMPIHVGQTYTSAQSDSLISSIYKTGLFSNVQLKRHNNTLVVQVVERPTIASILITGNKAIKSKQLKPVLKQLGIEVGSTYNPTQLHSIVMGLQQQYAQMGKASASVVPKVETLPRKRVALTIRIQEGKATILRSIHITGNKAFTESRLLSHFKLSTPGILSWYTHNDRYSEMRLTQDLHSLQNFYFNHGYLQFRVLSQTVQKLPNGRGVAIKIQVTEGPMFRLSGYRLDSKLPADLRPKVKQLLTQLKAGAVFSRQQVMGINTQIGNYLADHGYAFPQIVPMPQLNQQTRRVFVVYKISSGHRVYVNQIHIIGNTRTNGAVLRGQLRQMEGSVYSLKNVKESKRRLANLGYLNNIQITTSAVPGQPNQVDLSYHIHEVNAGRASVQGGYSDVNGFLYGASISEPNFAGTGRYAAIGFQHSEYTSAYHISYNNPFYTLSGISRGFSIFYNHTTPAKVNMDPYTMDTYGASVNYGFPVNEFDQFTLGGGYNHVAISNVNTGVVSPSVEDFLTNKPSPFNQFKITAGYSHSTLNRAIFPDKGNSQGLGVTLGVPALKSSLGYYQATYDGRWYFPIGHGFILSPHTTVGYGNGYGKTGSFPFFNNFYAGGIQTLPGYEANTLGPKYKTKSIGGNIETLAGLNLILPNFISHTLRTAVILDAGNVFETNRVAGVSYESVRLKNVRVTAGIMVSWWSPLGAPLDFSLAVPLNKKPGDQLAIFGFSFGATL